MSARTAFMFSQLMAMTAAVLFSSISMADSTDIDVKQIYKSEWSKFESDNFVVITNASDSKSRLIVEDLENFTQFIGRILNFKPDPSQGKLPVYVLKNERSYEALAVPENSAGYFYKLPGEQYIVTRADKFRSSKSGKASPGRGIVLHELVHYLDRNAVYKFARPPWYTEGVAEYLATFRHYRGNVEVGELGNLEGRFYGMRTASGKLKHIDTEAMFKSKKTYLGKDTRYNGNLFYGQAAMIVHYLFADKQRQLMMYKYLFAVEQGYSIDEAFEGIFNMTFAEFDEEVNKYARGRTVLKVVYPVRPGAIEFTEPTYTRIEADRFELMNSALGTALNRRGVSDDIKADAIKEIEDRYPEWRATMAF